LSDLIDSTGRRIIPIPPGRVVAGDHLTKDEYCAAFEKYTWVLRELRRLAGQDELLRANFPRVADLELPFSREAR
jgi:hypothetical protein